VNRRRPGLVVELLGAPGSGKSALATALEGREGVTVVKDHQPGDRPALAWSMARSWRLAGAAPPQVDRRRWVAWAARLGAAPHVARRRIARGAGTVVFDQGAAYTLVRMLQLRRRHPGNVWWERRCTDTACLLDLLVLVDADTPTLAARLRARRKDHPAEELEPGRLHEYLDAERRGCHEVADALAQEGAEAIRLVTTGMTPEEQVAEVLAALADADHTPALEDRAPRHALR
jgi:broad-specificity NMP kinase